jgi:hypothetical protein
MRLGQNKEIQQPGRALHPMEVLAEQMEEDA